MSERAILTYPDPRLKARSAPVAAVSDQERRLMDDMLETMYGARGIGLAAIQIGVKQRIIVMDTTSRAEGPLSDQEKAQPLYFVNPRVVKTSQEQSVYREGCLSVPGVYEEVTRPSRCTISFLDYHGDPQSLALSGLMATCIQHEMDHLDGMLFIDHLSRPVRRGIEKKLALA